MPTLRFIANHACFRGHVMAALILSPIQSIRSQLIDVAGQAAILIGTAITMCGCFTRPSRNLGTQPESPPSGRYHFAPSVLFRKLMLTAPVILLDPRETIP